MKLLIIEDNRSLQDEIRQLLESYQYHCEVAASFRAAMEKVELYDYDLVLVDLNLPGGSGMDIITYMKRTRPACPLIVISARNTLQSKIEGLELGADDYITKPFDLSELLARVKSVLRRTFFEGKTTLQFGDICIDTHKQTVTAAGRELDVTKTEYKLLLFFFSNPGRVLTREGMAEHVWGDHMDLADSFDFIYSHIKNLRKKIRMSGSADPIRVVYGVGYKLDEGLNQITSSSGNGADQ